MPVSSDEIPQPKLQQERRRFRYRPRARLKADIEPADITVTRMMQRAHDLRARYPGQSRLALRDLIQYLIATPPNEPTLLDMVEYCHAHIDRFSPRSQGFVSDMMVAARRRKEISEKQRDYLVDLFHQLADAGSDDGNNSAPGRCGRGAKGDKSTKPARTPHREGAGGGVKCKDGRSRRTTERLDTTGG